MKSKHLAIALVLASAGLPVFAQASDTDCFPLCREVVKADVLPPVEATPNTVEDSAAPQDGGGAPGVPATSCPSSLVQKAERLNSTLKPVRDIVGYVRSPQGLAVKLVNDHIVKIPAWVGYAMDPIGSIKSRAIDEVRTRAKDALEPESSCTTETASETPIPPINIYSGHSV